MKLFFQNFIFFSGLPLKKDKLLFIGTFIITISFVTDHWNSRRRGKCDIIIILLEGPANLRKPPRNQNMLAQTVYKRVTYFQI